MIVTLDAKRRLTVPAALAPTSPGDYFDARFDAEEDALVLRRLAGKEDWLAVLRACPVSPDDVPPRRRDPAPPKAMNWLLDTDVLRQPAKRSGDARATAWQRPGLQASRAKSVQSVQGAPVNGPLASPRRRHVRLLRRRRRPEGSLFRG
jgi:hypothetical protein